MKSMNRIPVTNPKQSKKLKELGINGVMTSDMMWIYANTPHPYLSDISKDGKTRILDLTRRIDALPAWTEQSLMDMLPENVMGYSLIIYPRTMDNNKKWIVAYAQGETTLRSSVNKDLFESIIDMIRWLVRSGNIEQKYLSNEK